MILLGFRQFNPPRNLLDRLIFLSHLHYRF